MNPKDSNLAAAVLDAILNNKGRPFGVLHIDGGGCPPEQDDLPIKPAGLEPVVVNLAPETPQTLQEGQKLVVHGGGLTLSLDYAEVQGIRTLLAYMPKRTQVLLTLKQLSGMGLREAKTAVDGVAKLDGLKS